MTKYNDYPFFEMAATASELIKDGWDVFQKYTCDHCGSRQTMDDANIFHTHGKCEECGKITDIKQRGCNYMLIGRLRGTHD
jgi:Fe2+ or Zn2+ uptake regulation protein